MDDISNIINIELNENRPILDNHKVNDNDILNGSAENKHSAAESVAFLHSSPLTEKQVLTSVNNNFQNEKPNISFTVAEYSAGVISNNSGENIAFLSSEAGTTKTENINSSSLAYEAPTSIEASSNISCKSLQNNSGCENEFNSDSDTKSEVVSSNEIPVGNVNFLPDALSDGVFSDNEKNLSFNATQCNEMSMIKMENIDSTSTHTEEIKDEKNNSYVVVPDLVDFSFREQENVAGDLLGSFTGIDSLSKQPESAPSSRLEEISGNNDAVNVQENKPLSTSGELLETDFANKVPMSPTNILEESGVTGATENCDVLGHSITTNSPLRVSENPVKEVVSNVITSDNISVEFEKPCKAAEEVSAVDSGSTNNEYREVNSDEAAFQVPENTSSYKPDEVSPLKVEKVSFGMSDKSLEEFADPEFESKVPEVSSNNPLEQFSDPDSAFKVPEVPCINPFGQFCDPDFAFKVPEAPSNNPLEQFSDPDFAFKMPENPLTSEGDEQFMDAVQFFKDPNSFQFLENIRTSTVQPESTVPRSSLYINFDPLHSKFQTNVPMQENSAAVENSEKCSPEVLNKHLVDVAAHESLGNILISFDSPKSSTCVDSKIPVQTPTPPKMFTEEEVQQKLKIHELETQDTYIKKQREMEMEIAKRDEILKFQRMVMEEFCGISAKLSDDIRKGQEKIISLEAENEKLKEDLKTSAEDLQSVENTFTDFYKRYEQCKGMLKTYKDNEEHLKQTISDLQSKAKEQEQMYHMLQERTEEMLEKANVEVDNVKRSGEAQVTVLKAQLKKAEMKISSLESDIKQIKMENSQLGGICDDLMAKVSRS
ncbi:Transforming acidic coiled-coil-containing protein 3 [Araneus ventricosus]|uniref:Transforming acidic coiled-coil-containing protein 3 n=1 Tax=Araneus ventricosus TaxID=182803 RepID=A0A4Y2LW97_ARAVE|nr:Transforming acidic coiled-coil-containing protein 3 [Araneus ventricosus]